MEVANHAKITVATLEDPGVYSRYKCFDDPLSPRKLDVAFATFLRMHDKDAMSRYELRLMPQRIYA
jgi:hypothetical protein